MAASPPADSNNRVTLAEIQRDILHLRESGERQYKEIVETNERQYQALNRRLDFLEEKLEINVSEVRENCGNNTTQIARLEERQKATTGVLAAGQIILSAIATTIGTLAK